MSQRDKGQSDSDSGSVIFFSILQLSQILDHANTCMIKFTEYGWHCICGDPSMNAIKKYQCFDH